MKPISIPRRWYGCHAIPALALPLVLWQASREGAPVGEGAGVAERGRAEEMSDGTDHAGDRLTGVWQRWQADAEGDPVRFYYFHGDGHGLYRYGKVGLTNTHAFDYAIEGDALALRFRRTGEAHRLRFRVEGDPSVAGRSWLTIEGDPREAGARYFRDEDAAAAALCGEADEGEVALGRVLGNRLWGEERRFAAGGMGFAIYQLQPQTIDGRGVGWFHRGDYDEWTTEALTYRQQGDHLTIHFMLEGRSETTPIAVRSEGEARWLDLAVDPRDYWRAHSYRDMGRSFAGAATLGGAPWGPGCLPAAALRR
ncbi:MAG TPA: hypothetical protein PKW35_15300 [Nannocystaceae bacterium]|nr:hypothetical protein [Nannocystaceae bacterium]